MELLNNQNSPHRLHWGPAATWWSAQHSTAQHSLQSLVFIIWKVKWRKNLSALYSRNLEFAYLIKSERFIVAHRNIQENLGKVLIFKRPPQKGSPKGGGFEVVSSLKRLTWWLHRIIYQAASWMLMVAWSQNKWTEIVADCTVIIRKFQ